ncbi:MAG: hypothetical protein AAGA60_29635 [Cyanobacteria bacterium P01_E01_bin.42]
MESAKFLHDSVVLFERPQRGIIECDVTPHCCGRVRALGSWWFAVLDTGAGSRCLEAGESVWVTGRRGIVLLVTQIESEEKG